MADFSMYHALGQGGGPDEDPMKPQARTDLARPQVNPPRPPPGNARSGAYYDNADMTKQNAYRDLPPSTGSPGYPTQQPSSQARSDIASRQGPMGGLTTRMAGLGIVGETGGSVRAHKKKHRHAYHDLGTPGGSSQPFNGMPQGQIQSPSQYLDTGLNQQPQPVSHFGGQTPGPVKPALSAVGDGSVPAQGKVDPEQIPSVPRSRDIPAQYYFNHVYPTMERHIPPPATIPFMAHDQGNSSPKFARLTLNNIPSTPEFLSSTALPLGLVLQPLAQLDPGEHPIPVLDFGDAGPPRCRRCRAYINPFMMFRSGGNKFVCNMCTFPNEVPPEYFAPVDSSGTRVDRTQRPELMMGTVEFLVPKEYWVKEPVGLRWLFLIDVSQEAVTRGFLEACCEGILRALYGGGDYDEGTTDNEIPDKRLPGGSRVGIITYDKEVHFYNLSVCL